MVNRKDDNRDLERDMIEHFIKEAPNNYDLAEDLLELFCDDVEQAKVSGRMPADPVLFDYVVTAFRRIIDGESPKVALNLVWRGGRGKQKSRDRVRAVSSRYRRNLALAREIARRIKYGMSKSEAFADIVESDAQITELACLSLSEYKRERQDHADSMGLSVGMLDQRVEERRDQIKKAAPKSIKPLA